MILRIAPILNSLTVPLPSPLQVPLFSHFPLQWILKLIGFFFTFKGDTKTKHEVGLAEVWTTISQIFTELKQFTDSRDAIEEAASISPTSPEVAYQRGLLAEAQSQIKQAAEFYKEAYSYDNKYCFNMW